MADPDSNRLAQKLCDTVDAFLSKQGFAFRENEDWESYVEQLIALVYHFYDDEDGGDSNYVPSEQLTTETSTGSVSLRTTDEEDDDMSVDE